MTVSIRKARQFLDRKERLEQAELDILYNKAVSDFTKIVSMIIQNYDPLRIIQWGSLLDRNKFRHYSDIDIAVEGVGNPESFFAMIGKAEQLTSFPLDIVDLNNIEKVFAEIIRARGVIVYEK